MPTVKKPRPLPTIEVTDLDPWLVDVLNKGVQSDEELRTVMGKLTLLVLTGKLTTARSDAIKDLLVLNHQSIQASKPPTPVGTPALTALRAVMEMAGGHQIGIAYEAPGKAVPPWRQTISVAATDREPELARNIPQIEADDDTDKL